MAFLEGGRRSTVLSSLANPHTTTAHETQKTHIIFLIFSLHTEAILPHGFLFDHFKKYNFSQSCVFEKCWRLVVLH